MKLEGDGKAPTPVMGSFLPPPSAVPWPGAACGAANGGQLLHHKQTVKGWGWEAAHRRASLANAGYLAMCCVCRLCHVPYFPLVHQPCHEVEAIVP